MTQNEDKFFEMFQDSFQDFAPAPPASVYTGVRQKMKWAGFLGFHYSTFNVWYLGLIMAGSAAIVFSQLDGTAVAGTVDAKTGFDEQLRNVHAVSAMSIDAAADESQEVVNETFVAQHFEAPAPKAQVAEESASTELIASIDETIMPPLEEGSTTPSEIIEEHIQTPMTQLPVKQIELGDHVSIDHDLIRQLRGKDKTIEFDIKVKLPSTEDQ